MGARPDRSGCGALSDVRGDASRRRAIGPLALAVIALLATAGWWLTRSDPPEPVDDPRPTPPAPIEQPPGEWVLELGPGADQGSGTESVSTWSAVADSTAGALVVGNTAPSSDAPRRAALWRPEEDVAPTTLGTDDAPSAALAIAVLDELVVVGGVRYPEATSARAVLWTGRLEDGELMGLQPVPDAELPPGVEVVDLAAGIGGLAGVVTDASVDARGTVMRSIDGTSWDVVDLGDPAADVRAVAVGRDEVVAVGSSGDGPRGPVAWRIDLASGTAATEVIPGADGVELVGITDWDGGWLVVGEGPPESGPRIWRDGPGGSWSEIAATGGPFGIPGVTVGGLATTNHGLVVSAGGGWGVSTSSDAQSWVASPPQQLEGWIEPAAPVALGDGVRGLVVGGDAGAGMAWAGADEGWTPIAAVDEPPAQVRTAPAGAATDADGTVVVVAGAAGGGGDPGPGAWRTHDGGWDAVAPPSGDGVAIAALSAVGAQVWASGSITTARGPTASAWVLADSGFERLGTAGTAFEEATSVGVGTVRVADEPWLAATTTDADGITRVAVARSDGDAWVRVPGPFDDATDARAGGVCPLVSGGALIVGTRLEADDRAVPIAWAWDGERWHEAGAGEMDVAEAARTELTSCATGPDDTVVLGTTDDRVTAWSTRDGTAWDREAEEFTAAVRGAATALSGDGRVHAVGVDPHARALVAWRRNGRDWEPLVATTPALPAVATVQAVVDDGGVLRAIGTIGTRLAVWRLDES